MLINVRDTSSVSCRDGQLERKVSDIYSPDGTEHRRESSLSGYARLPYNAFIYLSSSSRALYTFPLSFPSHVSLTCFSNSTRIERRAMIQMSLVTTLLHPSKLFHQCRRNSASPFPILSFFPLDGASRPTWLRFVG